MIFVILLCSTYAGHPDMNFCTPFHAAHYRSRSACEEELVKLRAEARGKGVAIEGRTTVNGIKSETRMVCKQG
jgi:hypothetical protein